ncbi:MAG: hypothetical protein JOS17DRAFT_786869 [Linnemannia elongata]|nr:MAG: hypothetical protein JOS17DRAFT_786869 [Linnemannia elongata]
MLRRRHKLMQPLGKSAIVRASLVVSTYIAIVITYPVLEIELSRLPFSSYFGRIERPNEICFIDSLHISATTLCARGSFTEPSSTSTSTSVSTSSSLKVIGAAARKHSRDPLGRLDGTSSKFARTARGKEVYFEDPPLLTFQTRDRTVVVFLPANQGNVIVHARVSSVQLPSNLTKMSLYQEFFFPLFQVQTLLEITKKYLENKRGNRLQNQCPFPTLDTYP